MKSILPMLLLLIPLSSIAASPYEQQLEDYRKRMLAEESVRIQKQRLEEESRFRQQQIDNMKKEQQLMRYQYEAMQKK